jgi:acyl carrier protein
MAGSQKFTRIEEVTDEEIKHRVADVLVEALGVDEDEIVPEARLGPDLGAESIDYLGISFQLEKAFPGLKIQSKTSDVIGVNWGEQGVLDENHRFTKQAAKILARQNPCFCWPEDMAGQSLLDFIGEFYRVEQLWYFIRYRIDHPERNVVE